MKGFLRLPTRHAPLAAKGWITRNDERMFRGSIARMQGFSPQDDTIKVPPPPQRASDDKSGFAEVTIRTMASDLKSLGESGGVGVYGETIAVPVRGAPLPPAPKIAYGRIIIWALMVIAGAGFLFLVGYYFIPALLGGSGSM